MVAHLEQGTQLTRVAESFKTNIANGQSWSVGHPRRDLLNVVHRVRNLLYNQCLRTPHSQTSFFLPVCSGRLDRFKLHLLFHEFINQFYKIIENWSWNEKGQFFQSKP